MAIIKQAKKHTGRGRKEEIVEEILANLNEASGIVLTDYKGLTHRQLEGLKKELKSVNSSFTITKNTLLKLALENSKFKSQNSKLDESLENPTATLFIKGDSIEALKKLAKVIKELGLPKVKIGIVDGQALDAAGIIQLSQLPTREVLLGQFLGMLNSPISGLVIVLNANITKFVMTLKAVEKTKSN
ncbi:MAG: 50S ribosomal protein L10 [Candidatus Levybacteria bacterium]|nr:50S ribosomal protein L10 [Candidatus Levybacteria bacterium]